MYANEASPLLPKPRAYSQRAAGALAGGLALSAIYVCDRWVSRDWGSTLRLHPLMMVTAFACVVLGALAYRAPVLPLTESDTPNTAHAALHALAVTFASIGIASVWVAKGRSHLDTVHEWLGLSLYVLVLAQSASAMVRKGRRVALDKFVLVFWPGVMATGVVQATVGTECGMHRTNCELGYWVAMLEMAAALALIYAVAPIEHLFLDTS